MAEKVHPPKSKKKARPANWRWKLSKDIKGHIPAFVIHATGLNTKKQLLARYGEGAEFEAPYPRQELEPGPVPKIDPTKCDTGFAHDGEPCKEAPVWKSVYSDDGRPEPVTLYLCATHALEDFHGLTVTAGECVGQTITYTSLAEY
jgi:hypothetical protein